MPNIVAHCWYGDVAITKSNTDRLRKIINKYHGVFLFGCQGPDPFYFYHRIPWQSQKNIHEVRDYGNSGSSWNTQRKPRMRKTSPLWPAF